VVFPDLKGQERKRQKDRDLLRNNEAHEKKRRRERERRERKYKIQLIGGNNSVQNSMSPHALDRRS
jgi:hypothetical protein